MAVDEIVRVPLGELEPWDKNPRRIADDRMQSLVRSMERDPEMLLARPLIALRSGKVIAGNMRLAAAKQLGWETVPTVYVDLTDTEAATWALRDNTPYGEWEGAELASMLRSLEDAGADLDLTGFSADDLRAIFENYPDDNGGRPPTDTGEDDLADDDRGTTLALADVTVGDPTHVVNTGELWAMGHHVLAVVSLYERWDVWAPLLQERPDSLFVPYPTPTVPLTEKATATPLVLVQPDKWLAGHLLDKYAAVNGEDTVRLLKTHT